MATWYDSAHCRSKSHCLRCRDTSAKGIAFRASLVGKYADIAEQDFVCPLNVDWDANVKPLLSQEDCLILWAANYNVNNSFVSNSVTLSDGESELVILKTSDNPLIYSDDNYSLAYSEVDDKWILTLAIGGSYFNNAETNIPNDPRGTYISINNEDDDLFIGP